MSDTTDSSSEDATTIKEFLEKACSFRNDASDSTTTTKKPWANAELEHWSIKSNNKVQFLHLLGSITDADTRRWAAEYDVPSFQPVLRTEDEVVKAFNVQIEQPVEAAFNTSGSQHLQFRSGLQSPYAVNGGYQPIADKSCWNSHHTPLAVGDIKAPGIIQPAPWKARRGSQRGETLQRLSNEIYGYAMIYRCAQAFLFDGTHMILLLWRAGRHFEGGIDFGMAPLCWVIPVRSEAPNITVREAYYYLIRRAWYLSMEPPITPLPAPALLQSPVFLTFLTTVKQQQPGTLSDEDAQRLAHYRFQNALQARVQTQDRAG